MRHTFRTVKKPQGDYLAAIEYMNDAPSKHGNPMVTFGFRVIGDDHALYPWYCPLVDESMWKLTEVFHALDLPTPNKRKILTGEIPLPVEAFLSQRLVIRLESDLFQSKWRSIVKSVSHQRDSTPIGMMVHVEDKDPSL
jgi:hypothetical protein